MILAPVHSDQRHESSSGARHHPDRPLGMDAAAIDYSEVHGTGEVADQLAFTRRAPRRSVILLLPDEHSVSPELLLNGLRLRREHEVDVLVACAGQPADLGALQRCVGHARFLLAPAGTPAEALREMALAQAAGDIVTLLDAPLIADAAVDQPALGSA